MEVEVDVEVDEREIYLNSFNGRRLLLPHICIVITEASNSPNSALLISFSPFFVIVFGIFYLLAFACIL